MAFPEPGRSGQRRARQRETTSMHNQPGRPAPVFVDRTGRRRRLTMVAGTAMGLGLLTSLGLIFAGLFFDSSVPLPGWSETKVGPPLEVGVEVSPPAGQTRPRPRPEPVTSITPPVPSPTTIQPTGAVRAATPAPRRSGSVPGQGDERRNSAKPSKSPGKP
ncbi:hypothetical protein [Micromonospora sp. NPDC047740]|uniref:hypothetical protein n=1 Tax=Micromonospora sp. NPDC047740 TaxID=3364254 RepID=UPI00371A54D8